MAPKHGRVLTLEIDKKCKVKDRFNVFNRNFSGLWRWKRLQFSFVELIEWELCSSLLASVRISSNIDGWEWLSGWSGEVYICGPSAEAEIPDGPDLVSPDPESTQLLKKVAGIISSDLKDANVRLKTEQACYMPCTDDEVSIMGAIPGMKHCYVASGHGCWGILFGPATGATMTELVLEGHSTIIDLTCFSPDRFLTT
ncbi:hypothetical protein L1987_36733 [Smallanthus sonchifolius]|uniref:Uncharacterized protein n=1 Tax=Smallanthus sonchifolius TaxID=185202 RepID=A0ACB9HF18_9ASTR|nr:hypothetical protein L1987_36733 [Smallanthus sonchifolius]